MVRTSKPQWELWNAGVEHCEASVYFLLVTYRGERSQINLRKSESQHPGRSFALKRCFQGSAKRQLTHSGSRKIPPSYPRREGCESTADQREGGGFGNGRGSRGAADESHSGVGVADVADASVCEVEGDHRAEGEIEGV